MRIACTQNVAHLTTKKPGDKKKCREVVLKEFGLCHKHFGDKIETLSAESASEYLEGKLSRVIEILGKLENQAQEAKKIDSDIYQRKNKLIPKFLKLKEVLQLACKTYR